MLISKMPDGKPEIYLAVQGEGRTIGKPMIFVRLANCNLSCKWCDTYYTWNFSGIGRANTHNTAQQVKRDDYVMQMSVAEVINAIEAIGVKAVNFTGGEPTLQQKDILEIMKSLRTRSQGWHFETETAGTVIMVPEYIGQLNQINCSPKLESSGNSLRLRNRPEVIKSIKESDKAIFKFVVVEENYLLDMKEIKEWQEQNDISNEMIFLMPEGVEKDRIIHGTKFLMDTFAGQGYNISTRLQVICYGTKRAV